MAILQLAVAAAGCGGAPDAGAPHSLFPRFVDVSESAGLAGFRHENGAEGQFWFPEQMGAGGGFVDFDADGWEDIVLVGGGRLSPTGPIPFSALRVYHNLRDGSFREVTAEVGLAGIEAYGTGIAAADYDNDRDQDLFLTALGENLLFRNDSREDPDSSGVTRFFEEVGHAASVAGPERWSSSALFLDADKDGFVDLFVAGYADWSLGLDVRCERGGKQDYCPPATYGSAKSYYYHNGGDGTFEDRTDAAGLAAGPGKSLALAEWDFNRDGYPDFVVVNDGQPNLLYMNDGDGTFTEVGTVSGIAFGEHGEARAGMGVDVGVLDATGRPTIFIGNFSSEMVGVYTQTESGWFVDRAASSRVGRYSLTSLAFGVLFFDVDMDADLDAFIANGHVYLNPIDGSSYREIPHLFVNEFDGTFTDVARPAGGALAAEMVARSVSGGDFDRDGDVDLLVTENRGPVHLLRNDTDRGHVLRVMLRGVESSRDALGTQVLLTAGGRQQVRRVRTGSSYLSQSEKTLTFGLGSSTIIDSLHVLWPTGRTSIFTGLPVDAEIVVDEDAGLVSTRRFSISRDRDGPAD